MSDSRWKLIGDLETEAKELEAKAEFLKNEDPEWVSKRLTAASLRNQAQAMKQSMGRWLYPTDGDCGKCGQKIWKFTIPMEPPIEGKAGKAHGVLVDIVELCRRCNPFL